MNSTNRRRRKLYVLLLMLMVFSLIAALVLYALRQNISLFYSPTQISQGEAPLQKNIRVGGMVQKGSLVRQDNLQVQFILTDFSKTIIVQYQGILPDLFREGQGVVAQGELLAEGHFKANQILAKHDENYMPPEVKAMLPATARGDVS